MSGLTRTMTWTDAEGLYYDIKFGRKPDTLCENFEEFEKYILDGQGKRAAAEEEYQRRFAPLHVKAARWFGGLFR